MTNQRDSFRILVADDDAEMRALIVDALRADGYEVHGAASGAELLDQLSPVFLDAAEAHFDLVISDIRMPLLTGLEMLAGLRDVACPMEVILITAFADEDARREAERLGALALFDKPFQLSSLRELVHARSAVMPSASSPEDTTQLRDQHMTARARSHHKLPPVTIDPAAEGYVTRILLAEDDAEMRVLLRDALRADGYEVTEVTNGGQLRASLDAAFSGQDRRGIDLIITDNRMPKCTGLDVLALLRARDWATPVVLITAFGNDEVHEEAHRLGVAAVLDKPFTLYALREEVRRLAPPTALPLEGRESHSSAQ